LLGFGNGKIACLSVAASPLDASPARQPTDRATGAVNLDLDDGVADGERILAEPPRISAGPLRAAWSWLKQTDLIPDKGQFRSRFHHPFSYCCPATILRDILAALFGRLRAG